MGYGSGGLLALILGAAALAGVAEAILAANDRERFPHPGRLVDVGTHKLHLHCTGEELEGRPTVILEAGLQLWSSSWYWVQQGLEKAVQVCSYDRSGQGWSEAGPGAFDGESIARELHLLLETAGVEPPYVLVGHSLGGMTVRIFYQLFPDEVAGMVLPDPGLPTEYVEEEKREVTRCNWHCTAAALVARVGFFRLQNRAIMSNESYPATVVPEIRAHLGSPSAAYATIGYLKNVSPTCHQTLRNDDLADVPVVVLHSTDFRIEEAETPEIRQRRIDRRNRILAGFRELTELSSRGRGPIPVEGSNHESIIMYERHADQVTAAILDVLRGYCQVEAPNS
ncbi:MAG: alpha/beta fold hydrolase [Thermoanaerobaculia bacterium]